MSRINAVLEKLVDFPNPQDVAATDGSCDSRMEDRAMKFVALAAQFVAALDDEGKVKNCDSVLCGSRASFMRGANMTSSVNYPISEL